LTVRLGREQLGGGADRLGPLPRQQFVNTAGRVAGEAGENVGEPGAGVDAVELGALDQRVHGGGAATALVGAGEGPAASAKGDAAQGALGGIVRQADAAVVEEAGKAGQRFSRYSMALAILDFADSFALVAQPIRSYSKAASARQITVR
jgi:hypothetical protein